MSVYFYYGDEDYNIELEINKLKSKLLDKNFASMNFKSVDNPNFADLISYLRTQPMMFGNQIIVINCADYFAKTLEDSQIKEIESALESVPESLCIIFVYILPRGENKKVDTRRKFYKTVSKYAQVQEFPAFKGYQIREISAWIKKSAKKYDISFNDEACNALIESVGSNLRELDKELQKLQLTAYPKKEITKDMIKEVCITNEDIFACTDFIAKGDRVSAVAEFRKLTEKQFPMMLLSAINTIVKKWVLLKLHKSQGKSNIEISKLTGQHEYKVKLDLEKLSRISLKELVQLEQNLTEAEYKIKSVFIRVFTK